MFGDETELAGVKENAMALFFLSGWGYVVSLVYPMGTGYALRPLTIPKWRGELSGRRWKKSSPGPNVQKYVEAVCKEIVTIEEVKKRDALFPVHFRDNSP